MKKLIYLILLAFIVASCGNYVPMNTRFITNTYKVVAIKSLEQRETDYRGKCLYIIETGTDHLAYVDNFQVIDSIGKFNVNDEVIFKMYKDNIK
jgi:hypothetical protein